MIIYVKGYFYLSMALSITVSYLTLLFFPHYYYAGYQMPHSYEPDFTISKEYKEYAVDTVEALRDYIARFFG